jgi:hypothetical protein
MHQVRSKTEAGVCSREQVGEP